MTTPTPSRRELWLGVVAFALFGALVAAYLHWPALNDALIYKSDVRQSPHWAAYHRDTFRADDLLVAYGSFNESPLQNAIYWCGTLLVDYVALTKVVCVAGYALYGALFFYIGARMFSLRAGVMAATSVLLFPDQFEYVAGGFSKMWMIPLLLVGLYLIEQRRWRGLWVLLPLAALAYPMAAVLIGAAALVAVFLGAYQNERRVFSELLQVAVAGVIGVLPLLAKYLFTPSFVGPMTSSVDMKRLPAMYAGGLTPYLPTPSPLDVVGELVGNPFVLISAVAFVVILRSNIGVRASWAALLIASFFCYFLAEVAFMRLYIPNRYLRYSAGVLIPLALGYNFDLLLRRLPRASLRAAAMAAIVALGCWSFRGQLRRGKDTIERHARAPLSRFLAQQPPRILVAGHPRDMDDIPVLARRSVLTNYKMHHSWFTGFRAQMDARTKASFRALYARKLADINALHETWGVTHLVVTEKYFKRRRMRAGKVFPKPYDDFVASLARESKPFLLEGRSLGDILWAEPGRYVVRLPIVPTAAIPAPVVPAPAIPVPVIPAPVVPAPVAPAPAGNK